MPRLRAFSGSNLVLLMMSRSPSTAVVSPLHISVTHKLIKSFSTDAGFFSVVIKTGRSGIPPEERDTTGICPIPSFSPGRSTLAASAIRSSGSLTGRGLPSFIPAEISIADPGWSSSAVFRISSHVDQEM